MAKRRAPRRAKSPRRQRARSRKSAAKRTKSRRSVKRPTNKTVRSRRPALAKRAVRAVGRPKAATKSAVRRSPPRLDRVRRTLDEVIPTPPSSLNLDRRPSAARSGREELTHTLKEHAGLTPAITAGDVDANLEDAYFSGDETPGGENPTPDQEVVDEIGKALGVEYQDNEELRSGDKVVERDKHRWELDPASSEDYKQRK